MSIDKCQIGIVYAKKVKNCVMLVSISVIETKIKIKFDSFYTIYKIGMDKFAVKNDNKKSNLIRLLLIFYSIPKRSWTTSAIRLV